MRDYYNRRVGGDGEAPTLTLPEVAEQLGAMYDFLQQQGYLQRSFGYECVDAGHVSGDHGTDLMLQFYLDTGVRIGDSVRGYLETTDEVGLFTLIEFLHDHTAKPDENSGYFHSFSGCGWHFDRKRARFDVEEARCEWRNKVNRILRFYGAGFCLSAAGEIERLAPEGLDELVRAPVPAAAGDANVAKVAIAIRTFLLARSTREQRKQSVRELADVLEFYRPQIKKHFARQDESALFDIANNFAIRHHRPSQKDAYDEPWLSWIFYMYLATVRLLLELVHRSTDADTAMPTPEQNEPEADDVPF